MPPTRQLLSSLSISLILLGPAWCRADVIFDTFGPNDGFDPLIGIALTGPGERSGALAFDFRVTEPVALTSARLALDHDSGEAPATMTVGVYAGFLDTVPSVVTSKTVQLDDASPMLIDVPLDDAVIVPGTEYGFAVRVQTASTVRWTGNFGGTILWTGTGQGTFAPIDSGQVPALRIEADPVPEPGAGTMLVIAACLVMRSRKRAAASGNGRGAG